MTLCIFGLTTMDTNARHDEIYPVKITDPYWWVGSPGARCWCRLQGRAGLPLLLLLEQ